MAKLANRPGGFSSEIREVLLLHFSFVNDSLALVTRLFRQIYSQSISILSAIPIKRLGILMVRGIVGRGACAASSSRSRKKRTTHEGVRELLRCQNAARANHRLRHCATGPRAVSLVTGEMPPPQRECDDQICHRRFCRPDRRRAAYPGIRAGQFDIRFDHGADRACCTHRADGAGCQRNAGTPYYS